MNNPKISIITPNFNMGEYLEDTIISVLSQDYQNLEYIIIDGGSIDNSNDIIKKYKGKLSYWVSEPDKGMYHAIQKGFDQSTGEIMAWINSDDIYHPGAFSIISEIFSNFQEINWLTATPTAIDERGRTISIGISRYWSKYDLLTSDYKWIQQESTFWRRSLWEKAGSKVDLGLKYAADFELWSRFFRFEKLYITKSLIGGFRWKSENQVTLEHIDEYINEVVSVIKTQVPTKKDRSIIRDFHQVERINNLLQKIKIFRTDLISKFKAHHFEYPPEVIFDRNKQRFIINK